jgi:hypothetical protein
MNQILKHIKKKTFEQNRTNEPTKKALKSIEESSNYLKPEGPNKKIWEDNWDINVKKEKRSRKN